MSDRKRWIPPDLKKVEGLARRDLTEELIAAELGIDMAILGSKRKAFHDFKDAVKRGRAQGIVAVASALYDRALGGHTRSMIYYLKTRAGWGKQPLEMRIDAGGQIEKMQREREESEKLIRAMTPAEREQYIKIIESAKERVRSGTLVEAKDFSREPLPPEIAAFEVKEDVGKPPKV